MTSLQIYGPPDTAGDWAELAALHPQFQRVVVNDQVVWESLDAQCGSALERLAEALEWDVYQHAMHIDHAFIEAREIMFRRWEVSDAVHEMLEAVAPDMERLIRGLFARSHSGVLDAFRPMMPPWAENLPK